MTMVQIKGTDRGSLVIKGSKVTVGLRDWGYPGFLTEDEYAVFVSLGSTSSYHITYWNYIHLFDTNISSIIFGDSARIGSISSRSIQRQKKGQL